jgi:XTP/dITP diphosphohydrolase
VLASDNTGKIAELDGMLAPLGWHVRPQGDFGVAAAAETGLTFVENALLKARQAAAETGLPALADDSGLAVDYLDGRPGIYSSRYAGADADDQANLAKLLAEMEGVPEAERTAAFHCVLVWIAHAEDPTPVIAEGHWPGRIAAEPAGSGGFGYDPVFVIPDRGCTAAELSAADKQALSHRGQAVHRLSEALRRRP